MEETEAESFGANSNPPAECRHLPERFSDASPKVPQGSIIMRSCDFDNFSAYKFVQSACASWLTTTAKRASTGPTDEILAARVRTTAAREKSTAARDFSTAPIDRVTSPKITLPPLHFRLKFEKFSLQKRPKSPKPAENQQKQRDFRPKSSKKRFFPTLREGPLFASRSPLGEFCAILTTFR